MAAVTPQPIPTDDDQVLAGILAARADLDGAVAKAGLTGDPIRYLLAASSAGLGAFASGIQAIRQPLDAVTVEQAVERLEQAAVRGADRRAAELARSRNRRTLLTYGGAFAISILAAVGGGFLWGQASANAAVRQTDQQLALAYRDGPSAAATWANLMRSNDANLMLAACTGLAVKTLEGRKACNLPIWLDPPVPAVPSRSR